MEYIDLHGEKIPFETRDDVPSGILYLLNDDFSIEYPLRRNGEPDMRFGINKMQRIFEERYIKSEKTPQS